MEKSETKCKGTRTRKACERKRQRSVICMGRSKEDRSRVFVSDTNKVRQRFQEVTEIVGILWLVGRTATLEALITGQRRVLSDEAAKTNKTGRQSEQEKPRKWIREAGKRIRAWRNKLESFNRWSDKTTRNRSQT